MELKKLTALRGVSGNERAVREYLIEKARPYTDDIQIDRMGNLIVTKIAKGNAPRKTVILCAHMDEIGLIVTGITEDGLLHIAPVGTIDPRIAVSKRVLVGEKEIPGVIGAKAIHLQSPEERTRVLPFDKLYVDIGAKDKRAAKKLATPGDYISFDSEWVEFGEGLVKSRALDDRVGCLAMLRALENEYPVDLVCAFTVQEELGLRGAMVAGHHVKGDCAIILEGTSANDIGMVDRHQQVCKLHSGVAISFMDLASVAHPGMNKALRALADKNNIPWQVKTYVSGGNDAGMIQRGQGGLATCVLSVPCRYIHSPSSVAALSDIDAQYRLVDAFLLSGANFQEDM